MYSGATVMDGVKTHDGRGKKVRPGFEPVHISRSEVSKLVRMGIFYFSRGDPTSPYYLNNMLYTCLYSIFHLFNDPKFVYKYMRQYVAVANPCCISIVEYFLTKFVYSKPEYQQYRITHSTGKEERINVAGLYKSHVALYRRKEGTDYFQRGPYKILYRYNNRLYPTTVQQCNNIVFMHSVQLLSIVAPLVVDIEHDMKKDKQRKQQLKNSGDVRRRTFQPPQTLSICMK